MPFADFDPHDFLTERKTQELQEAFGLCAHDGAAGEDAVAKALKALGHDFSRRQILDAVQALAAGGAAAVGFEEFCALYVRLNRYWPRPDLIDHRNFLDEAEIERIDQAFKQRDPKGLGWIDLAALQEILEGLRLPGRASSRRPLAVDRVLRQAVPSGGRLDFPRACAVYAVLSQKRRRLNYREFLSGEEVGRLRSLFEGRCAGERSLAPLKQLEQMLAALGVALTRPQVKFLVQDLDHCQQGSRLSFEEFCVLMCRIGRRRRQRVISPSACDPMALWREEAFSIRELLLSGFKLAELRSAGIQTGSMYKEGVPISEIRRAGLPAAELRRAGASAAEMRAGGFSLADLRLAGFSDMLVCEANRKMRSSISDSALPILAKPGRSASVVEEPSGGAADHAGGLPRVPLHRGMTAVIREHMDCRPWRSQSAFHLPALGSKKASAE
mmetsp:Transcript_149915/g.462783  ORF Transcript_149915/g.462783 Transcript_149915/m.462783 type:complete len:442 (+) Transcript_149915:131-1456(+)